MLAQDNSTQAATSELPSPSLAPSSFFFLQVHNCSFVRQGKCDIDKSPFAKASQRLLQLVEMLTRPINTRFTF